MGPPECGWPFSACRLYGKTEGTVVMPLFFFSRREAAKAFSITEEICGAIADELCRQDFSTVQSDFLQDHLTDIMSGIRDPQIKSMHPMADFNQ